MMSEALFEKLEQDFVLPGLVEHPWATDMRDFRDLVTEQFKQRSIGLVCDHAKEIREVRTAVFPSPKVLSAVVEEGITDALLFLHHPAAWDIRRPEGPFYQMERGLLEKFKSRRLSIYALHVPLDNFSEYSTSATLAQALGIQFEEAFLPYGGGLAGVIGASDARSVEELQKTYSAAVGHKTALYAYGSAELARQKVAVVAGGGNSVGFLQQVVDKGINTLVSGITVRNDFSKLAHEFAMEKKINLLGSTHYSSEAFACKAMCRYFEGLGLTARYVEDDPCLEDM